MQAGETVLILGAGPIGLALIEVAKLKQCRVIIADVNLTRLDTAGKLGAEIVVSDTDLLQNVLSLTEGEGAVVVFEATGVPSVMEMTVDLVAAGGRIVILGIVKRGSTVTLPALDFTRKEMTILGSRNSVGCFPEAIDLLANGKISYPALGTEVPMYESAKVFAEIDVNPRLYHKVVLVRNEN